MSAGGMRHVQRHHDRAVGELTGVRPAQRDAADPKLDLIGPWIPRFGDLFDADIPGSVIDGGPHR